MTESVLIVVAATTTSELAAPRPDEQRVGGKGPGVDPVRMARLDCRAERISSSHPNSPCSPAWGFSPATAILGRGYPNLGSSVAVRRMVAAIESAVRARGTSASGIWTVANTTRSASE
jgi:hypothetical protein